MSAALIGLGYTGSSASFAFVVDNFGGNEFPRTFQQSASYTQSANGTSILSGSAFRQKYQWAISTIVSKADADILLRMFQAWDIDRSTGLAAAVGIVDQTGPGEVISTDAVFVTTPSLTRMGPQNMMVSFGLAEV